MLVYIASDHAGFEMKKTVENYLLEKGHDVVDVGSFSFVEDDDYPDYIHPAIQKMKESIAELGEESVRAVILGGSGTGEAIVANRYKNVRAMVFNSVNLEVVKLGREHNNANVLSVGARFVDNDYLKLALEKFLETPFDESSRHSRRLEKIDN